MKFFFYCLLFQSYLSLNLELMKSRGGGGPMADSGPTVEQLIEACLAVNFSSISGMIPTNYYGYSITTDTLSHFRVNYGARHTYEAGTAFNPEFYIEGCRSGDVFVISDYKGRRGDPIKRSKLQHILIGTETRIYVPVRHPEFKNIDLHTGVPMIPGQPVARFYPTGELFHLGEFAEFAKAGLDHDCPFHVDVLSAIESKSGQLSPNILIGGLSQPYYVSLFGKSDSWPAITSDKIAAVKVQGSVVVVPREREVRVRGMRPVVAIVNESIVLDLISKNTHGSSVWLPSTNPLEGTSDRASIVPTGRTCLAAPVTWFEYVNEGLPHTNTLFTSTQMNKFKDVVDQSITRIGMVTIGKLKNDVVLREHVHDSILGPVYCLGYTCVLIATPHRGGGRSLVLISLDNTLPGGQPFAVAQPDVKLPTGRLPRALITALPDHEQIISDGKVLVPNILFESFTKIAILEVDVSKKIAVVHSNNWVDVALVLA